MLSDFGISNRFSSEAVVCLRRYRDDVAVRATAVRLWQECSQASQSLPTELEALVPSLLTDRYVAVHGAMARALPRLRLSEDVVRAQIWALIAIADAHREDHKEILKDTLQALLWAAQQCDDKNQRQIAQFVIDRSSSTICDCGLMPDNAATW